MRRIIAAVTILISAILLFTQLDHYALWDDEAVTALAGRGVWETGDTSVLLDHNIVAYRSGLLLSGTKERSTPPLGAYIAAPFVGLSAGQAFVARLPFVLIALGSVGLMLFWLYTIDVPWLIWLLLGIALIGNVSFWLYSRQCRYYSPVIFCSIAVAYFYLNWNGGWKQLALLAVASVLLLAGNYLNYLALQICMLVDYVIVGRKRRVLGVKDWLIVLLPQVIIGGVIVLIWNTLGTGNKEYLQGNSLGQRFVLAWMNLRDINTCEYGVGLFVLAAPILFFFDRKQSWLWRGPIVVVLYVTVVSMLSPQVINENTRDADVRYLAPLIPLGIAMGVMVTKQAARLHVAAAIGLAVLAFGTNLLNGQWIVDLMRDDRPVRTPARSTLLAFIGELSDPPIDPYRQTVGWISRHVQPGQSIYVTPDYANYPLMFHAPWPVYAWQLDPTAPLNAELAKLPNIHFAGRQLPDFLIAVGISPKFQELLTDFRKAGIQYEVPNDGTLSVYPTVLYRPELFWHRFAAEKPEPSVGAAVFVFQRPRVGGSMMQK